MPVLAQACIMWSVVHVHLTCTVQMICTYAIVEMWHTRPTWSMLSVDGCMTLKFCVACPSQRLQGPHGGRPWWTI
jgi:hypothetical protein